MKERNFSERMGIVDVSTIIQHDSMNKNLRNSLWNVLDEHIWRSYNFMYHDRPVNSIPGDIMGFSYRLWCDYLKRSISTRPNDSIGILGKIDTYFAHALWHEVYDFLEFVLTICKDEVHPTLQSHINDMLERELSGFRLIEGKFARITNENEIEEISEALNSRYSGCQTHLRKALEHMSNRESPDYRNSIKESISAVESVAREITDKESLDKALMQIKKSGKLHGALKSGFLNLYGYTSDADGIRHAVIEDKGVNLTLKDAKYFLITCSAFVNYLIAMHADTT